MSDLRKVSVPITYGVVAKVTLEAQGSETWVTVEAIHPQVKKAYRFHHLGHVRPKKGDAVIFSGTAKVEFFRGKAKWAKYYHDPMDKTPRSEWSYADLVDASCVHVGPWEIVKAAFDVADDAHRLVRSVGTLTAGDLSELLLRGRAYVRALEARVAAVKDDCPVRDSASP